MIDIMEGLGLGPLGTTPINTNMYTTNNPMSQVMGTLQGGNYNSTNNYTGMPTSPQTSGDYGLSLVSGATNKPGGIGSGWVNQAGSLIKQGLGMNPNGDTSEQGKFNTLWGGLSSLHGMYQGHKLMQMQKQQQDMQMDMWNKSWEANKKQINEAVDHRANSKFGRDPDKVKQHKDEYSI